MTGGGDVAPIDDFDAGRLEVRVAAALACGDDLGLRVLGYGEITLVLGWPAEEPAWACKRLPRFPDDAAAARYADRFDSYLALLAERGVTPVPSRFHTVAPGDGGRGRVGYVVQPALPAGSLGPDVLRAAEPDPAHPLLAGIVAAVPAVVDERTGLDGQLSNWAVVDGELVYLDVTTPMRFTPAGRIDLDLDLFLAAYPWALRGVIGRFVAPDVIGAYRDPRHVLLDLVGNLHKERLAAWIPAAVEAIGDTVSPRLTVEEAERYYRSDARLWEVMLRLRRADRRWQRAVRRRTYPFLLPGPVER